MLANELKQERAAIASLPQLDDPVDVELDKLSGTIERRRQSGQRMRLDDLAIEVRPRRCPTGPLAERGPNKSPHARGRAPRPGRGR